MKVWLDLVVNGMMAQFLVDGSNGGGSPFRLFDDVGDIKCSPYRIDGRKG